MSIGNSFDLEGFLRLKTEGVDDAADDVRNVEDAANDAGDAVETNLGDKLGDIGSSMQGIGTKLTAGVTLPIAGIGAASLTAASDAEEAESRFENVFENTSDRVSDFAEDFADDIGRSSRTIKDQAADFGSLLAPMVEDEEKAAALSEQFTTLTQDISSFEDMDPQRVQEALMSAISGEGQAVRQFGVELSQESVDEELQSMGVDPDEATRAQEAQARLNRIMEDTESAQGNAAETADSFKNQTRALMGSIKDLRIEIGRHLIPFAKDLIGLIEPAVSLFGDLSDTQQRVIIAVAGVAAALGPLLLGLGSLLALIPSISAGAAALGITLSGPLILGVVGAVAAIAGLVALFADDLIPIFEDAADFILDDVIPPFVDFAEDVLEDTVQPALEDAEDTFDDVMGAIQTRVETVLGIVEGVWARHGDEIAREVDETVAAIRPPLETALGAVEDIVDGVLGRIEGFWNDHETEIRSVVDTITTVVDRLFETGLNNLAETVKLGLNVIQGDWGEARDNIESIADNTLDLVEDAFRAGFNKLDELTGGRLTDIQNAFDGLTDWLSNTWDLLASLTKPFRAAYDAIVGNSIVPDLVADVKGAFRSLRDFFANVWNLSPLSDTFEAVANTIVGGDGDIVGTLRSDVESVFNSLRDFFASAWNLHPLTDTFEAVATAVTGDDGIIAEIQEGFEFLNFWFVNSFDLDSIASAFSDAFDAAADAIESGLDGAISAINSVLDPIATAIESTIGAVNQLNGVDIDIDVPQPEDLIPDGVPVIGGGEEEEEQPPPPPRDDDDDDTGDSSPGPSTGGGEPSFPGGSDPGNPDDDDEGGTGAPNPPSNPGVPGVGVATGGYVAETGAAMLHSGERVFPDAQVTDRGEASFDPNSVADGFDESTAASEMVSELRQLRQAVESGATVSERDILDALNVALDRNSGRDPLS